jgi:SAM-dependent methyltransferase
LNPSPPLDPQSYINRLRTDPESYSQALARECEVWGKLFSAPDFLRRREQDQAASRELGIADAGLNIDNAFASLPVPLDTGLSLACGSGQAEREFISKKFCKYFHGIDISSAAITQARNLAQGLPVTYQVADLNRIQLQREAYDFVLTQTCLHHIVELEHLASQIAACLRPGGYLWIHDYIGESQFQYSDEKLSLVNAILETLPDHLRYNELHQRSLGTVTRPPVGHLASPFEAIRSAEIMPIFLQYFDILKASETNAVFNLLCPVGTRAAFLKTTEGRALVKTFMVLDALLIEHQVMPPCSGRYLLQLKPRH